MVIDEERIKEIFGEETLYIINANEDIIIKNAKTMEILGFEDIEGLFERCPSFFLNFPNKFKIKLEKLKEELGPNYIELIENDVSIIEKM